MKSLIACNLNKFIEAVIDAVKIGGNTPFETVKVIYCT